MFFMLLFILFIHYFLRNLSSFLLYLTLKWPKDGCDFKKREIILLACSIGIILMVKFSKKLKVAVVVNETFSFFFL